MLGGKKQKKRKHTRKTTAGTASLTSNSSVHNEYDIIEELALSQNEQHYDKLAEFYRYFLQNPGKYRDIFNLLHQPKRKMRQNYINNYVSFFSISVNDNI